MISLEKVLSPQNMLLACKRVRVNKGAPGVDGMTVDELEGHFRRHWASICAHIRAGRYIPSPVKRVDIPKSDGGTRMLGIPTVPLKSSKAPTNYFTPNILRKSWSRLVVSVVHLDALAFPVAAT